MHARLTDVFASLGVSYEIIFVNDGSPDDTDSVLRELLGKDEHVLAIEHSRNFGSQSAFVSGMQLATGDAVILLDGDLQDPPELISAFYAKWRAGNDVVYGRRVKREGLVCWRSLRRFSTESSAVLLTCRCHSMRATSRFRRGPYRRAESAWRSSHPFRWSSVGEILRLIQSFAGPGVLKDYIVQHMGPQFPWTSNLVFGIPYVLFAALGLFVPLLVALVSSSFVTHTNRAYTEDTLLCSHRATAPRRRLRLDGFVRLWRRGGPFPATKAALRAPTPRWRSCKRSPSGIQTHHAPPVSGGRPC